MSLPNRKYNPPSLAAPVNNLYSHGVEVPANSRHLFIAGQVAVKPDGSIPPDLPGQVEQIMRNIGEILRDAGMTYADIVKVNGYCLKPEDIFTYAGIRNRYLGEHAPATTAVVVAALAKPEWLVEVDAVAARND